MITFIGILLWQLILFALMFCITVLATSALAVCIVWLIEERGRK